MFYGKKIPCAHTPRVVRRGCAHRVVRRVVRQGCAQGCAQRVVRSCAFSVRGLCARVVRMVVCRDWAAQPAQGLYAFYLNGFFSINYSTNR